MPRIKRKHQVINKKIEYFLITREEIRKLQIQLNHPNAKNAKKQLQKTRNPLKNDLFIFH